MKHGVQLPLERCPHCNVAKPLATEQWSCNTSDHAGGNSRLWKTYLCKTCGGVILAVSATGQNTPITEMWPSPQTVSEAVPARAREFLSQAILSLHAPAGAIMLTASSVDAMLKDKGYREGTLHARIDAASRDHLITTEMAAWAHEIRLDAIDQRHSDANADLPTPTDAHKAIEFASALAQFLYVLPARVERGRKP